MDINEAALRLKKIEVIQSQIAHLQSEASAADITDGVQMAYANNCNTLAHDLCLLLKEFWL